MGECLSFLHVHVLTFTCIVSAFLKSSIVCGTYRFPRMMRVQLRKRGNVRVSFILLLLLDQGDGDLKLYSNVTVTV